MRRSYLCCAIVPDMFVLPIVWVLAASPAPSASRTAPVADDAVSRGEVAAVLDDFHRAASVADEAAYFGHLTPDAEFLGTDPAEHWTAAEFRAYAHPLFAAGKGWTYVPKKRTVHIAGDFAWFDETLDNAKYGTCRGSGVLRRLGGAWKIAQYNLTFLVPNALAEKLTGEIRAAVRQ